ncbi:tRNA (adenosine(37)-N6)-dimethylallyltransferase MiaA [Ramlibacter humi]|uniref:tRNA dimethylallyltransferase n=1 Tax=Ramlibacter humi TaxID=2530451 RepID=A0A4Z0CEE2_9BURK|nr:tRNA (adenosine(37)-N6)-dimethylallyltransferase MiaA [Ramlibacter humi]TFZ08795.1 tRNA (adenosine(37)-N6)-dimethylallyltransferase MiaA [Ramlibacter humi]
MPNAPRLLALAGPTASGKTDAAMALAGAFPSEIVSVDSALVYRGMDIGTAKPTAAQRAAVPHHLIDIRDPSQPYSAAEFARDAARLVTEINARGRVALLVGGTMLYFKALFEGLDEMPAADAAVRAAIEDEARTQGWPAMHAELAKADPVTAARLAPNDSQRIQRALEVFRSTGKPLSEFHGASRTEGLKPLALLSLEPDGRAWLHERIAQRFDAMLAEGFLDEVRALRARGDLDPGLPSLRSVGYRQAWQAMDEGWGARELRDRGIFATRQLAKRQITWLRGMQRTVIACDRPGAVDRVLQAAKAALA